MAAQSWPLYAPGNNNPGPSIADAQQGGVAPLPNWGAVLAGLNPAGGMSASQPAPVDPMAGIRDALVRNALTSRQPSEGKILGMPRSTFFTLLAGLADSYGVVNGRDSIMPSLLKAQSESATLKNKQDQAQSYVDALVAQGMDPSQAVIVAADPSEMSKHIGTRFDATTIDEGSSRYTPNLDGSANVFTAPKTFQNKADVTQMPGSVMNAPAGALVSAIGVPTGTPVALGNAVSIPGLRTEAEQYAASTGALPGTPAYLGAVQDYELRANGPTAFGHAQSLQNARLTNAANIAHGHDLTSAANNTRSTSASTANNRRSVGQSNINNQRSTQTAAANNAANNQMRFQTARHVRALPNEPVAVDAQGRKIVVRNGQWVPAQ